MRTPLRIAIIAGLAVAVGFVLATKRAQRATAAGEAPSALAEALAPPATNLPRLLDLGAGKCVPCKAMAPILEALRRDYEGRMIVEFIDVWKDEEAGRRYGVEMIPTQIFFSADGKELARHTGFLGREDLLAKWKELGVEFGGP